VGQVEAAAVVPPGVGVERRVVGPGGQIAGYDPGLLVAAFGQRRVGVAAGAAAGGGIEVVVGRFGVADEVDRNRRFHRFKKEELAQRPPRGPRALSKTNLILLGVLGLLCVSLLKSAQSPDHIA